MVLQLSSVMHPAVHDVCYASCHPHMHHLDLVTLVCVCWYQAVLAVCYLASHVCCALDFILYTCPSAPSTMSKLALALA